MRSLKLWGQRVLPLWLAWWLLAYLAGAAFVDASAMGLVLSLQGLVGCAAISTVGLGSNLSAARVFGLSTAIGAAITTLPFQFLLLFVDGVSPLLFTIAITLIAFFALSRTRIQLSTQRTDALEIGAILVAALTALGLTTGWHLLHVAMLGSMLIIVGLVARQEKLASQMTRSLMIFGPVTLLSWWFRESVDLILLSRILWDGDNSIFQLLINTTERWGVLENIGASGQSPIIGYHWATFAWMGMLEGAANSAPWITLQFVMPLVASLVVAAMLWEIAASVSRSTALRLAGVIAAMALFFQPDGSVSLYVSDVWLIAFALIAYLATRNQRLLRSLPLTTVLFAGVLIGKRSSGVLVVAALLVATVFSIFLRQWRSSSQFGILSLSAILVLAVDQLIARFGQRLAGVELNNLTSGAGRVRLEFISDEAFGYAGTFTGAISVLGALFVTLSIFFPQFVALLKQFYERRSVTSAFIAILSAVAVSAVVPFVMTGEVLAVYFYSRHLGLVVGSILVLTVVLRHISSDEALANKKIQGSLIATAVGAGFAWFVLFEILQRQSTTNWTIVKEATWIPTLAATAMITVMVPSLRNKNSLLGFSLIASVILAGMVATPKLVDELSNQRIGPLVDGTFTYDDLDLPSDDVTEVGTWIRSNTPVDSVIGSNYFCESRPNFSLNCTPENWWVDWLSRANEIDAFGASCQVETAEKLGRIQNYLLPSLTDRRFLIQGPGFSLGCRQPPEWITERIRLSESFARNPSKESCNALLEMDTTFFVVDRRTTGREFWDGFATERMANNSFRVLELNEGFCRAT